MGGLHVPSGSNGRYGYEALVSTASSVGCVGAGPDLRCSGPAPTSLRLAVWERFGGRHGQLLFRHGVQLLRLLRIELVVHEQAQHLVMLGLSRGRHGLVARQVCAASASSGLPYARGYLRTTSVTLLRTSLVIDRSIRIRVSP